MNLEIENDEDKFLNKINGARNVMGTHAYWFEQTPGQELCWFGVNSGYGGWNLEKFEGSAPSSPDDEENIGRLLKELWDKFGVDYWKYLSNRDEDANMYVCRIIALADEYRVSLKLE